MYTYANIIYKLCTYFLNFSNVLMNNDKIKIDNSTMRPTYQEKQQLAMLSVL